MKGFTLITIVLVGYSEMVSPGAVTYGVTPYWAMHLFLIKTMQTLYNKVYCMLLMLLVPHYFCELVNVLAKGLTLSTSQIIIITNEVYICIFCITSASNNEMGK